MNTAVPEDAGRTPPRRTRRANGVEPGEDTTKRRTRKSRIPKTFVEAAPTQIEPATEAQPATNGVPAMPLGTASPQETSEPESATAALYHFQSQPESEQTYNGFGPLVRHRGRRERRRERLAAYAQPSLQPAAPVDEEPATTDESIEIEYEAVEAPPPALPYRVEAVEPPAEVPIAEPRIEIEDEVEPFAPVEASPAAAAVIAPADEPPAVLPAEDAGPELESEFNPECPACGDSHLRLLFKATDRLYRTTGKVFQIVECKQCRLIRLEPRPTQQELARYYPEKYWFSAAGGLGRLEEAYRRLVLRDHIAFVRQALANSDGNNYLLDVGCGNGLLLSLLPHQKILGFDLSLKALSIAWKQNGVPGACADLADVPLRRGSCSVVTMFHVIEHLPDPVKYLQAARELLTSRGRLVIQVPNASSWQFILFGQNWNGIDVPRHLFDYRQRDIEGLLNFCGFEITRRKHFSLRDNPAGMASSIAPGLDPMARRVRRLKENSVMRFLKDAAYFGLVLASLPFTAVEAACGCGSTIMIEARKKV